MIGLADAHPKSPECFNHAWISFTDRRSQFGRRRKKRAGFLFDDPQIIIDLEFEIKTALRLDHFSRADFPCSSGDCATDIRVFEIGGEIQGMREKAIAQKNTERISPARIHGWLSATALGLIQNVVVNERGDMN